MFDPGKGINEIVGGGTGTDANDALGGEPGFYIVESRLGGTAFSFVLSHTFAPFEVRRLG